MDDFSDRQLQWAYWWVNHRASVRRFFVAFLTVVVIVLSSISLFLWGRFFWYEGRFQQAMNQFGISGVNPAFVNSIPEGRPTVLQFGAPVLLPIDDAHEDRVLEVENVNTFWVAHVTYRLGENGTVEEAVIFPKEKKLLMLLGATRGVIPTVFGDALLSVRWQRVQGFAVLRDERLQLWIHAGDQWAHDPEFIPGSSGQFGVAADRVVFTVTNRSAFNYAHPAFIVVLRSRGSNGDIFAVNRIVADAFRSDETRGMEVRWLPPIPHASIPAGVYIQIEPDVDITDPTSFY